MATCMGGAVTNLSGENERMLAGFGSSPNANRALRCSWHCLSPFHTSTRSCTTPYLLATLVKDATVSGA